jgi:hypothetical protein
LDYEVYLGLDPGLFAGELLGSPEQTLAPLIVRRRGTWSDEDCLTMEQIGPAMFSELVRDLESLRA